MGRWGWLGAIVALSACGGLDVPTATVAPRAPVADLSVTAAPIAPRDALATRQIATVIAANLVGPASTPTAVMPATPSAAPTLVASVQPAAVATSPSSPPPTRPPPTLPPPPSPPPTLPPPTLPPTLPPATAPPLVIRPPDPTAVYVVPVGGAAVAMTAPTATAASTPTAFPTIAPATVTTAPSLGISFTSVSSPVRAGDTARATILTAPGAICSIVVTYESGPAKARGLDPLRADDMGSVTWTWLVGGNTTPGSWPIDVMCERGVQRGMRRTLFAVT